MICTPHQILFACGTCGR